MGVTVKTPPPPVAPPPAPDQSSLEVQKFGALFRRKAAAASGYASTFPQQKPGIGGAPVPVQAGPGPTQIVIDPTTGQPTEVPLDRGPQPATTVTPGVAPDIYNDETLLATKVDESQRQRRQRYYE